MKFLDNVLIALSAAALVACGGGGGSAQPPVATVSLSGVAAKGILKQAKATAYEVVDGQLVSRQSATTNDSGEYKFDVAPTSNPLVVKVEVVKGQTKMLDESQLAADGQSFVEVDAPEGLELRTMVDGLSSDRSEVNANPFTEMVVAGAVNAKDKDGNIKPLTNSTMAASRAIVMQLLPQGVTPESIKPLNPTDKPTESQKAIMTLLTGLAAQDTDLPSALKAMAETVQLVEDDSGKIGLSYDGEVALKAKLTETAKAGKQRLQALSLDDFVDITDYSSLNIIAVDPVVEVQRASLDSFVSTMKAGLTATQDQLQTAQTDFESRLKTASFELTTSALESAVNVLDYLKVDQGEGGYALLQTTCAESCGFTLTNKGSGTYEVASKPGASYVGTATLYGRVDSVAGTAEFQYKGQGKKVADNTQLLGDFDLNLKVTGIREDGSLDVDTGSVQISNMKVNGTADDGKLSMSIGINNATLTASTDQTKITLQADEIHINTNQGDDLRGSIAKLEVEKVTYTDVWTYQDVNGGAGDTVTDSYSYTKTKPRFFQAKLTGTVAGTELANLEIKFTDTTPNDAPSAAWTSPGTGITYTSGEPSDSAGTVYLKAALVGGTTLIVDAAKTLAAPDAAEITISAAGNTIKLTRGEGNSLTISSPNNAFTTVLDADRSGELKAGSTVIGTISKGVLSYDGRTVSLF